MNDRTYFNNIEKIATKFENGENIDEDLKKIINNLITHPDCKKNLDIFYKNDGEFSLIIDEDVDFSMAYIVSKNSIHINALEFLTTLCKEEASSILAHELHHAATLLNGLEHSINLRYYETEYDEKSIQKIHQSVEIGATYHQIIIGFEKGESDWDFIEFPYPKEFEYISNLLEINNISQGSKIPKHLKPAIADITTAIFTETTGLKYKEINMFGLEEQIQKGFGHNSISAKKIFEIMDCPITFNENELEDMLLFDERFIPHMSEKLKKSASFSTMQHDKKIQDKVLKYINISKNKMPPSLFIHQKERQ